MGITPGPTQMTEGNDEARRVLMDGGDELSAIISAKRKAAFSGNPMRPNLVGQLNHWGVHEYLGISDADELFMTCSEHLVHNTSLLRYPVFRDGEPFAGTPNIKSTVILRDQLNRYFRQEIAQLPKAIFLTLGPVVEDVMNMLIDQRVIPRERVFFGMVHPSPRNSYRLQYLTAEDRSSQKPPPHRTNVAHYDNGRARFSKMLLGC